VSCNEFHEFVTQRGPFLALTNSADSGQKRELAVKPYAQIGSSGPDLDFGVEFFERGAGPFA
jgi:hypothetical protein